ncbi:MAG: hypothetical protein ACRCST_10705 [Turicibacter sp.]
MKISEEYFKYDEKIKYYLYNLIDTDQKYEINNSFQELILPNELELEHYVVRMYLNAKENHTQSTLININGKVVKFSEVFNKYFDLHDLKQLLENDEKFIEVVSNEIVNNITISYKDVSGNLEAEKLFQAEIKRSVIMAAFSNSFPDLVMHLAHEVDLKTALRVKQIESKLQIVNEIKGNMKKKGWFR